MRRFGGGLSSFDIAQYEGDYRAWRDEVRRWFAGLHDLVARRLLARTVFVNLANQGEVSAARLMVRCELAGGAILLADDSAADDLLGSLLPPAPPERPEPRGMPLELPRSHYDQLRALNPATQDPTGFRWVDRPGYDDRSGTYGCQDFRPGRTYRDALVLLPDEPDPSSCTLTVSLSADDMSVREASVTVAFETVSSGWSDPDVLGLLPVDLVHLLQTAV